MKLNKPSTTTVFKANVAAVNQDAEVPFNTTDWYTLASVIAQMFDEIANGADLYMILGATSKRDAFTCTIKDAGTPTTFYGASLGELAQKLEQAI